MDPILKNLVRVGRVSSVDPDRCMARVAFEDKDEAVSHDLPVLVRGALAAKDYWLPSPGELVVCLYLPSGNSRGFVLGSLYSEANPPPVSNGDKRHISFVDGTRIEYDAGTHTLIIDAKGPVNIVATGNVNVTGDVRVSGDLNVSGDVVAGDISLKTHVHGGVMGGSGTTGPPE